MLISRNKKGMLSKLIMGFVIIAVGTSLVPIVSQQFNEAMASCGLNGTAVVNLTIPNIPTADTGKTNSFGGGGSEHFGGYTGKVEHKSFVQNVQTLYDNSVHCPELDGGLRTFLQITPAIFAMGILAVAISVVAQSLREGGLI